MKYFKNVEAASIYHVSEKSVRNWIEAARKGKLELDLHEKNGKFLIANTTKNQMTIKELVKHRQKFKNSRGNKIVSAKPEFYALYSPEQIFDIFSSLDIHREIPLQYTYMDQGAEYWDLYTQRLLQEKVPNMLTSTIQLLDTNRSVLMSLLSPAKAINVVDLGVGNALPLKNLLGYLHTLGLLNRYIGIDISESMLKIADRNINEWFDGKVTFEKYIKDLNYDRFSHTLVSDAFSDVSTIVTFFGGTLSNLRSPSRILQTINDSMGRNDLLVYALKLDTAASRRYFDFEVNEHQGTLDFQEKFVLDLLNIDDSYYDIEQFFDEQKKARFIQIKLKVDLTIEFAIQNSQKRIELKSNERITLWRYLHQSSFDVIKQLDAAGFELLQASKTPDQEYLLTISKVKTETPGILPS